MPRRTARNRACARAGLSGNRTNVRRPAGRRAPLAARRCRSRPRAHPLYPGLEETLTTRCSFMFSLTLALTLAAGAAHAAPSITGSDVGGFVADAPGWPHMHSMTLYGSGLALPTTTGYTFDKDISVWARWSDGNWVRASNTDPWFRWNGWASWSDDIQFLYLDHPGTIIVAVCVPDVSTCAFHNIDVRARATAAPVLSQPMGASIAWSSSSQSVSFAATNLTDDSCVWIEGGSGAASIALIHSYDGWGQFWFPSWPVGDYHVWVSNVPGCSNWSNAGLLHVRATRSGGGGPPGL